MPGISVVCREARTDTDDAIRERVLLDHAVGAEADPDEPPADPDRVVAATRARPARIRRPVWEARDAGGTLVGSASTAIDPDHDDNPDTLEMRLHVHPAHRRGGAGTALLGAVVAFAEAEARTRLFANTNDAIPGGVAFATALGAVARQAHHVNHLPVAETDRAMLETWVAEAADRSADYELVGFDGACPDEHVDGYVAQVMVLNTAPRDGVEVNDFVFTPAMVREHDAQRAATSRPTADAT